MKIQYKLFTSFAITLVIVGGGSLITLQTSQKSLRTAISHNQVIHTHSKSWRTLTGKCTTASKRYWAMAVMFC
jgi:CHASE3 domain sensor protein